MSTSPETPFPPELAELSGEQNYLDDDNLRHECGVFAVCAEGHDLARNSQTALERMKHRGHDSAGIAAVIDGQIVSDSEDGAPENLFTKDVLDRYRKTTMTISGTRYATTGAPAGAANRHPFGSSSDKIGEVRVVYNGNMIDGRGLHEEIVSWGIQPIGDTDSELVAHYFAHGPGETLEENIIALMKKYRAGYSGVAMTKKKIIAFVDPFGVRPLHLGQVDGGGWAIASETRVFRSLQYHPTREIRPGEIVRIEPGRRPITVKHMPNERIAPCIFEKIYFSGPESELNDQYVGAIRDEMGRQLAREDIARGTVPEVDVIFGIPESGWSMGEGYAEELDRQGYHAFHKRGIIRNRGRSFNDPDPRNVIEEKFNPLPHVVRGRRVCVVDDSLIRGNTAPYILDLLRDAGATEVHFRVASPPFIDTCHKGVNIPTRESEIANHFDTIEEIATEIRANSLQYLSLEGTLEAAEMRFGEACTACISGVYPMHIPDKDEPHIVSANMDDAPDKFDLLHSPTHTKPA